MQVGRGLDIYKPPEGKLAIGAFDLGLRCVRNIFWESKFNVVPEIILIKKGIVHLKLCQEMPGNHCGHILQEVTS